ncbi:serine/threonine-protein kinase [Nonomuraea africana]|uniref:non-specific serine/threonine protein kinase n=1 Tax=Nonomuraea africana TaxID=46171 RepID=A0ABR9KJN3_9ACTN|nr:serine/threonine-protein kinase [Nonomuraea africana]MBE1562238.1 serine/threonine-protein kinase PknG [Nonomuraea africana]
MTTCTRQDCAGTIEDGYCDLCGHPESPPAAAATTGSGSPIGASGAGYSGGGGYSGGAVHSGGVPSGMMTAPSGSRPSSGRRSRGVLGHGLVDVPPTPYRDPADAIMDNPEVPEDKRVCSSCGNPVGRSREGVPGRTEGFCPHDGTPYSFTPKLAPGALVAGQYRVLGCLAHGGLGWIYLAADENLDGRWVVLKGLLNAADTEALAAAEAERKFLTSVDHPNIVKIFNFQRHEGAGYIVMEYVGGPSLQDLLRERLREGHALPVRQTIAYTLEILKAFDYLHANGLVYCDLKPANVIQVGQQLKLIDLGAVQRIGAGLGSSYVTAGYHAPEISTRGPSIASDLYTVARTLAVLSHPFSPARGGVEQPLPGLEAWGNESFHRFLLRATDPDPDRRFADAAEMAEQLTGVLREIRAAEDGVPYPGQSGVFGPERVAEGVTEVFEPLDPAAAVAALPVPLMDPADPSAGLLSGLIARDPQDLLAAVAALPVTTETLLTRARVAAEHDLGESALEEADRELPGEWRVTWYRAVRALATGKPDQALFDRCFSLLPGEPAVKLALGFAHELAGDHAAAARWYQTVWRTDQSYVSAAFGLARTRLTAGDHQGAAAALDQVPASASQHVAAQLALVAVTARRPVAEVGPEELVAAGERLDRLNRVDGRRRGELSAELLEAALEWIAAQPASPSPSTVVLGAPLTGRGVRTRLESVYRELARAAPTRAERHALVDRANAVRPRTWL